jgi:hypothetical protein
MTNSIETQIREIIVTLNAAHTGRLWFEEADFGIKSDFKDSEIERKIASGCSVKFQPIYCLVGDYVGSLVEASNIKELRADFQADWISEEVGSFGSRWVEVDLNELALIIAQDDGKDEEGEEINPKDWLANFREALDGLCGYPLYSEDGYGEMELEAQQTAMDEAAEDAVCQILRATSAEQDAVISRDEIKAFIVNEIAEQWADGSLDVRNEDGKSCYCNPDPFVELAKAWHAKQWADRGPKLK